MTKLTDAAVHKAFTECLFNDGEPTDDKVVVEGITLTVGFHPGRLAAHKQTVMELLKELPEQFLESKGGGWSFLNACTDREGSQWTDYHASQQELLLLGIATGQAKYCLPKELWTALPGGMPYFIVLDKEKETK